MMDHHHQSLFLNRLLSEHKHTEGIGRGIIIPKIFQSYFCLGTTPRTSKFQPVSVFILTAVGMSQHRLSTLKTQTENNSISQRTRRASRGGGLAKSSGGISPVWEMQWCVQKLWMKILINTELTCRPPSSSQNHAWGILHFSHGTRMWMLPLQVSGSHGEMASIVPNLPVAEKPQATSLKQPKSRAAPGLVPRRLQCSPSSLTGS